MQWRVYAEHIWKDEREKAESLRDLAEYAMAFHNYEAVIQVQEARAERVVEENSQVEDVFFEQLRKQGFNLDKDKLYNARDKELGNDRVAPRKQEDDLKVRYAKDE